MKAINNYLLRFALTAALLTALFRCFLSYGITHEAIVLITVSSILYAIGMSLAGWYWGKKEKDHIPIYDVGFRFHLATYLVFNVVSEGWFFLGFNSGIEKIETVRSVACLWGFFLFIHFIYFIWTRKKTINNIDKTELFE